jgi:hypothetical protein
MDTTHSAREMTHITVQLSSQEVRALKNRTGKRTAGAALKAWIANADTAHTTAQLRSALTQSMKEESEGKGRRFKSGREAVRWLES